MKRWLTPARAFVASFLLVILAGTLALQLPGVTQPGKELAWHEALFTSTSAVCVTGLVVRSPKDFTVFGQTVIAVLIELGGLGILTFGFLLVVLMGGRISFFGRELVESTLAQGPWEDFLPLLRTTAVITLGVEAVGAGLLTLAWAPSMGVKTALGWGVFHSVSAFCNAGFGLDPSSLIPWRRNAVVVLTVAGLIIVGGLGFLPFTDLYDRVRSRRRRHLALHTRLVFVTTAALIVVGTAGIYGFEWNAGLAGTRGLERLGAAFFQAVTPRTAGFATVDYARFSAAGLLFTIVLMFIGASPGSTGGGIKTTTLGVLVAAAISRARGHERVNLWNRTLPYGLLGTAAALTGAALSLVLLATLTVLHLEAQLGGALGGTGSFLKVLFEVVSAFGTVGLSTGITAKLLVSSRLVLVAMMFLGRVGPLTFGLALSWKPVPGDWQQPEESVMIG